MTSSKNTEAKAAHVKPESIGWYPAAYSAMSPQARYSFLTNPVGQQPQTPFIYFRPDMTFLGIERQKSWAEALNCHQNNEIVASLLGDIARFVVGRTGGEVVVSSSNPDWDKAANEYINDYWSENCDFRRTGATLNSILHTVEVISCRDGDCLVVCDHDITDGKVLVYEADQICSVADFSKLSENLGLKQGSTQSNGVVFDELGRCVGYTVTLERQQSYVPNEKATFIPFSAARLKIGEVYRANQIRGDSMLLCLMTVLGHNQKLLESTVISAQRNAEDIAVHKINTPPVSGIMSQTQQQGLGLSATPPVVTPIGGVTVKVFQDEDYKLLAQDKPEPCVTDFGDWFRTVVYKRFGLYSSYATGKVAGTNQGRAETLLSHVAIADRQKSLGDGLVKWLVRQAIEHGKVSGDIGALDSPKFFKVECLWPELPTTEFDQTAADQMEQIRMGAKSFSDVYGHGWEKSAKKLSEETKMLRAEDMSWLGIFADTVTGNQMQVKGDRPAAASPEKAG